MMLVPPPARRLGMALAFCAATALLPSVAQAATFGFTCLTGHQASSCGAGEQQLVMDVSRVGPVGGVEFVMFEFRNSALAASSITDIYFDEAANSGVGLAYWIGGQAPGVDYRVNATPANPAGASGIGFSADASWNAYGGPQGTLRVPNGIDAATEWVRLVFSLGTGTFDSLIAALGHGTLRVALEVQGFSGAPRGETFINRTAPAVPEPGSLLLLGSGLAAIAAVARRRQARA